jgi:hypothetical protein
VVVDLLELSLLAIKNNIAVTQLTNVKTRLDSDKLVTTMKIAMSVLFLVPLTLVKTANALLFLEL